jgi:hypothetical protein
MNTKEKGTSLEYYVASLLNEAFNTLECRPTRGSGCGNELGDVSTPFLIVECKNWDKENVILKSETWKKLCNEIPIKSPKIPMYVFQTNENKKFAILDLEDLARILSKCYSACGEIA